MRRRKHKQTEDFQPAGIQPPDIVVVFNLLSSRTDHVWSEGPVLAGQVHHCQGHGEEAQQEV